MEHLHTFESLNESKDVDTIKKMVLDFAEKKGKSKWKELQAVILKHKGLDPTDRNNRGQFSSYFSGGSDFMKRLGYDKGAGKHGRSTNSHGLLMRPTANDPRYLEKDGKDYTVKVWDGKSKLS
tara:strand:+ start:2971 stop:3339 length:369 start_codon:yes stop_codon:yes gene_type:complete